MSDAIRFVPPRVQLVNPQTGVISREWYLFFQGVFDRIGGATGPSLPDTYVSLFEDAGSSETNAALFVAEQALQQLPPSALAQIDQLYAELNGLRELVSELTKEVEALKQATSL
jgi:hypothetical protein